MTIKVATIALTATAEKRENINNAFSAIERAADLGAQWILLPEVFSYHGPYDQLSKIAEPDRGPLYCELAEFAAKRSVVLFAGTFAVRSADDSADRVYNRMYVFDRSGNEVARYTKTHLFNLLDSAGEPLYCESDGYIAGDDLQTVEVDGFQVGLAICYDLRFSGLYQSLNKSTPVDVLINAAAFTYATGKAHWETLLKARSIEYQAYHIAANQVGEHGRGKRSYGHSMIVDPWGDVLSSTGDEPGIAFAEMTKGRIAEVRSTLPALSNRRPELY